MQILVEAKKYIQSNRRHRVWQKVVCFMAGCVVFCTTYALILPAITMEQKVFCGHEEHTHSEECYVRISQSLELTCSPDELELHVHSGRCLDAEGNTVCGLADYVAHTHNADCVDENGVIVCAFPEIRQHVHDSGCYSTPENKSQIHTHSNSCYNKEKGELVCTVAEFVGHVHSAGCYTTEAVKTCTVEESAGHSHTEECYITENTQTCTMPESVGHTHASECCDAEGALVCTTSESAGHSHGDGCYTAQKNLICGRAEQEAHAHGDSCYETPIICGMIETDGHAHTDSCYAWNETVICGLEETPIPEPELICIMPIAEVHVHSADCFESKEESLTCQLEESEEHTHSALCYGTWNLICIMEEHTHELTCFSDPEADLETAQIWERTFANVKLTGVWADDVLAIAETQLGYTESTRNYAVWEDGTTHGYTRYGDWYGSPYGDWCAMFVSFCVHYAEIDGVPLNWGCRTWIEELSKEELDLYRDAGEYEPKPGDIVFFDWEDKNGDSDDLADHVGLVAELIPATETEPAKIKTIEGNSSNQVKYNTYDADDTEILGYGIMPENPELEAEEETEIVTARHTFSDDTVYVEVRLPEDTDVPEDAVLKVAPISAEDESYAAYVAQAEAAVEGTVANIALYDISFYTADDDYIPVSDTAAVTMGFVDSPVDDAANVQVLHFAEAEAAPAQLTDVTVEERELEMHLPDTQLAPIAEPEAEAVQFSLRTILSEARSIEPLSTEPETATVTETRTVIEFTTDGFSTFAVVEVETGSYTATVLTVDEWNKILNPQENDSLNGRTFVIAPDYAHSGVNYALTSEQVTINEWNDDGYHEYTRLNAGTIQRNNSTVTTPADDGFLWKFEAVPDKVNTYYIQSVETEQYLYIGSGETVKTTKEPNEIIVQRYTKPGTSDVSDNGDFGRIRLFGENNINLQSWPDGGVANGIPQGNHVKEGIKVFSSGGGDNWNELILAEYKEEKSDEPLTIPQWPLDERQFVISWLDNNQAWVMTNNGIKDGDNDRYLRQGVKTPANGNLNYVELGGIVEDSIWKFAKVDGQSDTYYIQAANGQYLNLSDKEAEHDESSLTLSDTPQAIKVTYNNDGTVLLSAFVGGKTRYVNHYDNRGFGCYGDGTRLTLTEYAPTALDGRFFVITNKNGNQNAAITSTSAGFDPGNDNDINNPDGNTNVELLKAKTDVLDGEIPVGTVWKFTAVEGKINTYYIQPAYGDEGQYLNITRPDGAKDGHASLTVGNTQQDIEVVPCGDEAYLIRIKLDDTYYYVNLFGGNTGRGFGAWNGTDNHSQLVLTEYAPTDLAGRQFIISKLLDENGTSTAVMSQQSREDGTGTLTAAYYPCTLDENRNPVPVEEGNVPANVLWQFEAAQDANNSYTYHIKAGENHYLNIGENGALTVGEDPQVIEVVYTDGNRVALRVLANETGTYRYVSLTDSPAVDDPYGGAFGTEKDFTEKDFNGYSALALTEYPIPEESDLVYNLADQMYIICAVDSVQNDPCIVTDVATEFKDNGADRLGLETTAANDADKNNDNGNGITINNANSTVIFDDNNEKADYSNMIWKFIGTDTPGYYYIQSQSVANGGKYLHLDATGVTLSDEPQTIAVVTATTTGKWNNVVCLRVTEADGTTRYLNLCQNNPDLGVTTYANAGTENNGNHFILAQAQLTEEDAAAIKAVTDAIDALPNQETLVQTVRQLLNVAKDNDDDAQELQDQTVADASAAIEAYNALTDEQKLFVGVDRINKLEELRVWLVSEDAETGEPIARLPGTVDAATASGVTVKVFNYNRQITNEDFYNNGFRFFNNSASVDGDGNAGTYTGALNGNNAGVTFKLNADGYPVLVDGNTELDLSNLFNGTYQQGAAMSDGGGLFQQDKNGYYYYYSDMNAAYYDPTANDGAGSFVLYDTVVRPPYIWWTSDDNKTDTYIVDRRSNFLPFNALISYDEDDNPISNIVYDSEDHQAQNEVPDHDLSLDEQKPAPTAIINETMDLWFGMSMEFNFFMPQGGQVGGAPMIFDFHGDDDVWVFIDDVLVLDLGGTHEAWDGNIDFATGDVESKRLGNTTLKKLFMKAAGIEGVDAMSPEELAAVNSVTIKLSDGTEKMIQFSGNTLADYSSHNLKFFYMERGGAISYNGIKFNLPTLPPNALMVNKVASSHDDQNKDFQFRVVEAGTDEKPKNPVQVLLKGTEFTIMEAGVEIGTRTVGDDGIFTLKPGQSAVFANVNKDIKAGDNLTGIIVQEILAPGVTYNVSYQVSSNGTIVPVRNDNNGGDSTSSSFSSSIIDHKKEDNEIVTFYNTPTGSGTLSIEKKLADGVTAGEDKIFYVRVRMGQNAADTLIPVGTQYHIDGDSSTHTVKEPGIIELKAGQTATIIGITPNLHYEVAEFLTNGQKYKPTYTVEVTKNGGTVDEIDDDEANDEAEIINRANRSGVIGAGETVSITIENDEYDKYVELPITKEVKPAGTADNFYFLVDQVTDKDNLTPVQEYRPGVLVQVGADGSSDANIMIGIESTEENQNGPWYFKVYEEETTSNYFYDPTYYIVEVKLVDGDAVITNVWKNGTGEPITNLTQNQLRFVNRKFTELTVEKTVVNVVEPEKTGGSFPFTVTVKVDGTEIATHEFTLAHNGKETIQVPYGAVVTATETNNAGYYTRYEVYSRYEAENGELSNDAQVGENANTSGGKYVANIGANNGAGAVTIFPNMLSGGNYSIRLQYNTLLNRSFRVIVNNDEPIEEECVGHWADAWYLEWFNFDLPEKIRLEKGTNTIDISGTTSHAPNLDYVDIILTEEKAGTAVTQSVDADHITIHFTNQTGYELPQTGGTGTYLYTIGGLMLMMAAAILLYSKNKRGKEELASS